METITLAVGNRMKPLREIVCLGYYVWNVIRGANNVSNVIKLFWRKYVVC